jgi:acetylornithine deacetylase
LPGTPVEDIRCAVIDAVTMAAQDDPFLASDPPQIVWNGFQAEGAVLEPGSDAERVLEEAHFAVVRTGMKSRLSTAVNDTRYYNLYQHIPALCYGPAGEGLHGFDERADLANLKQTTLVIAAFIAAWCGAHSNAVMAFART